MGRLGHEQNFWQLCCEGRSRIPATNFLGRYEAPTWGFLLSGTRTGRQHRADKNGLYAHFFVLKHDVIDFR